MTQLKNLLQERISDTVYHITLTMHLYSILKNNEFILTPTLSGSEYKYSKNKFYYLSTARSKYNSYFKGMITNYANVSILVLDGNKLNNKYSGFAMSYFNNDDETEDRIISNKPTIPNAKSYIKEIHIKKTNTDINLAFINAIKKIKDNIPVYIYENIDDFKKLNKTRSINKKIIAKTHDKLSDTKLSTIPLDSSNKEQNGMDILFALNNKIYYKNEIAFFDRLFDSLSSIIEMTAKYPDLYDKTYEYENIKKKILNYIDAYKRIEVDYFINLLKKNHLTFDKFINNVIHNLQKGIIIK